MITEGGDAHRHRTTPTTQRVRDTIDDDTADCSRARRGDEPAEAVAGGLGVM